MDSRTIATYAGALVTGTTLLIVGIWKGTVIAVVLALFIFIFAPLLAAMRSSR